GLSCGNRPPRTAFPTLPTLPALPSTVDPASWLKGLDGLHLERQQLIATALVSIDLKRDSRVRQAGGSSCELAVGCHRPLHARLFRDLRKLNRPRCERRWEKRSTEDDNGTDRRDQRGAQRDGKGPPGERPPTVSGTDSANLGRR